MSANIHNPRHPPVTARQPQTTHEWCGHGGPCAQCAEIWTFIMDGRSHPGCSVTSGSLITRVIVSDDNERNRGILSHRLRRLADLDIRETRNGLELVNAVCAERPDLVFTDLKSPVMDGAEAIARIRQMEGGRHIAIVVVSAAASIPEYRDLALRAGCDVVIRKPVVDPSVFRRFVPVWDPNGEVEAAEAARRR